MSYTVVARAPVRWLNTLTKIFKKYLLFFRTLVIRSDKFQDLKTTGTRCSCTG
jgi:hypothetical protein